MLRYHAIGQWGPGEVETRFVGGTRVETPASREAIETAWARLSADPAVHLFDGPMCRLEAFRETKEPARRLCLDLSVTSYRIFAGTNLHGPRDLPAETLANPLGVSPALETSDGFLLFGRRTAAVAYYPHRLHPFSGSLEPPGPDGHLDIFDECRRELAEELSLRPGEVPEIVLLGVVEDTEIRHPELILHAHTILPLSEVVSRLDPKEHVAVHAVPVDPAAIENELANPAFTPVARAAMTLFAHVKRTR